MLKILDETVKVTKTSPSYQIVIDAINDGINPDGFDMERLWEKLSQWEARLIRLNSKVKINGYAMIPDLYKDIECFLDYTDSEGFLTDCKPYLNLLKYHERASFANNTHRHFKKIWSDMGGQDLDKEQLEEFHNNLFEYFDNLLDPYTAIYTSLEESSKRKLKGRNYTGLYAAKYFHDIAPMFASICTVSKDFSDSVLDAIGGKTPGLTGDVAFRITNALDGILNGKLSVQQASKIGDSFISLMYGCLRVIPRMSKICPYAIPLAISLFPDVWKFDLTPRSPICTDDDGVTLLPWEDIAANTRRGGISMKLMYDTATIQNGSGQVISNLAQQNTPVRSIKPNIVWFSSDETLIDVYMEATALVTLPTEFRMTDYLQNRYVKAKISTLPFNEIEHGW